MPLNSKYDLTPRIPLKIIYFALIFSTFVYCFIVWTVTKDKTPRGTFGEEFHDPMVLVPMLLSFGSFAVSFALRIPIVRWAVTESVCIYGLVATFLTNDWRFFAIGWVLSLTGYALSFPGDGEPA